jgi:hypothetical protein
VAIIHSSIDCQLAAHQLHVLTVPLPCCPPLPLLPPAAAPTTAAAAADAAAAAPVKGDLLNVSYYPSRADAANVTKRWYIIDAKGQTLGRLATLAATYVRCVHRLCVCVCGCTQAERHRQAWRSRDEGWFLQQQLQGSANAEQGQVARGGRPKAAGGKTACRRQEVRSSGAGSQ